MSIPSDPKRLREIALSVALGVFCVFATAPTTMAGGEREHPDDHGEPHDDHGEHGHHDDHDEVSFSVEDFEKHGVRLGTAGRGVVDAGIELPAEVRPNSDRLAHLAPRFPGIVREVRKHVGDSVRAGDVLALIESENLATYRLIAAFDGTVIDKHITPGEAVSRQQRPTSSPTCRQSG